MRKELSVKTRKQKMFVTLLKKRVVCLGRSKGTHLRRLAVELMQKFVFSEVLEANKEILRQLALLKGNKKEFNKLAGEITTMAKQKDIAEREKEARAFKAASAPAPATLVRHAQAA